MYVSGICRMTSMILFTLFIYVENLTNFISKRVPIIIFKIKKSSNSLCFSTLPYPIPQK